MMCGVYSYLQWTKHGSKSNIIVSTEETKQEQMTLQWYTAVS